MKNIIGQSLGRYHIIDQLGEGGMATVYRAYDTRLESEVAVKFIRTDGLPEGGIERALKRFEREAKMLAKLTHPNIVKVIDYGEYEGQPYLVMPYLVGGTLKDRMKHPIPWQKAARLLVPIARALEYAHHEGMIHRDVKPSNILITGSEEPMLTDFGIAKIIDDESTMELTGANMAVGTPEYMAPEQVISKYVDHRVDIYSLGMVFYEMVTGHKPFHADTPMAVLLKQANEPLPRPTKFMADLPSEVENVLFKALAKKADDRYPDAGAFAAALEGLSISGRQPVPSGKTAAVPQTMAENLSRTFMAPGVTPGASGQTYLGSAAIPASRPAGRSRTKPILGAILGIAALLVCLVGGGLLYATDGLGMFTTPTSLPTAVPMLNEDPKAWLPSTLHIPPEMVPSLQGINTNEDLAAAHANPAERLAYLNQVGRETGYFMNYVNSNGCSYSSGLTYISFNPVRMKDPIATLEYANQLYLDVANDPPADLRLNWVDGIGERAFVEEWTYQDNCDPKNTHLAVTIRFARYNGLVGVTVQVRSGLMTRERLYEIAENYALLIANHMKSQVIP